MGLDIGFGLVGESVTAERVEVDLRVVDGGGRRAGSWLVGRGQAAFGRGRRRLGPGLGGFAPSSEARADLERNGSPNGLNERDMRALLQMGANDSTNLIDMPDASRLGMHRALLYSEETGTIEPFRPYALTDLGAPA